MSNLPAHTLRFADWLSVQLGQTLPSHTLRFAEWLNEQLPEAPNIVEFRQMPGAVPATGYFVDKQGRWRDKKTGRFVNMPLRDKELARQLIRELQQSKLLQLQTKPAYQVTLEKLLRKFKDNPDALELLDSLKLAGGVKGKAEALQRVRQLQEMLRDDTLTTKEITQKLAAMKPEQARAIIADIEKLKLLQLQTAPAWNATVQQLRRKYKDSPEALDLIDSLRLENISRKAEAESRLQKLSELLKNSEQPTTKQPELKHTLRNIALQPTPINADDRLQAIRDKLNSVDINSLTDSEKAQFARDKAALDTALKYRQAVEDLNNLVNEANSSRLSKDDYDRLFDERNRVWSDMKSALDESQGLKSQFLSESALDEYMQKLSGISREAPGGFKIALPTNMAELKERAAALPC